MSKTCDVSCATRGKIHQVFSLCFCILKAIKNWSQGRPGNETTPHTLIQVTFLIHGLKRGWVVYLLQCSVNGCEPLLHVLALDGGHKRLELLQQLWVPLKVIVVELHPVPHNIQDSVRQCKTTIKSCNHPPGVLLYPPTLDTPLLLTPTHTLIPLPLPCIPIHIPSHIHSHNIHTYM